MDDVDVRDANRKELVSDTMFRKILPPELKLLSGTHKQGCCCETCTLMSNLQSAYNRAQVCIRMQKEKDVKQLEQVEGKVTRERKEQIAIAKAKLTLYKSEAFGTDGGPLYPKAKHAADAMQCVAPNGFKGSGITAWKCASGDCTNCGKLPVPKAEEDWDQPVNHYIFKYMPTCSKHGTQSSDCSKCPKCVGISVHMRGKWGKRKHLVLDRKPFPEFKKLYLETLKNYCQHRFKFLILSKKRTTDVRELTLRKGEVSLQHDFAEGLKIVHNQEVKLHHYPFVCFVYLY